MLFVSESYQNYKNGTAHNGNWKGKGVYSELRANLFSGLWVLCEPHSLSREVNAREENSDYVVFKWNIHGPSWK